jgi:hypothetical protein
MSYAGRDPRSRRSVASASATSASSGGRAAGRRVLERELPITPRGISQSTAQRPASDDHELDWQHIAIFATGALLGAMLGAGAALLLAPQSGARTRHDIARQGRQLRERTADAWEDLRHELRHAARRGRKKLARRFRDRRERRELHDESMIDD